MQRERIAAEVICKLFLDRRVGGRHLNEQAARTGLPEVSRGPPFDDAMRWLAARGWLLYHAKGRPGKDDQVSLEPSRLAEMLRFARDHLPSERLERLANSIPADRRHRLLGGEPRAAPVAPPRADAPTLQREDVLKLLHGYAPMAMFQDARREFAQRLASLESQGVQQQSPDAGGRAALEALRQDLQRLAARLATLEQRRAPRAPTPSPPPARLTSAVAHVGGRLEDLEERLGVLEAWMASEVPRQRRHFLEDAGAVAEETGATLDPGVGRRCSYVGCRRLAEHAAPRLAARRGAWRPEGVIGLCQQHARGALLVVRAGDLAALRSLVAKVREEWTPLYLGGDELPARRFRAALRGRFPGVEGDEEALWPRGPRNGGAEGGKPKAPAGPATGRPPGDVPRAVQAKLEGGGAQHQP